MRLIPLLVSLVAVLAAATPATTQDELLQEKINIAIDKGVKAIRQAQGKGGDWPDQFNVGMTGLCAWTLLAAGVSPKDPAVAKAATFLRDKALNIDRAYDAATMIFFLDHLGDPSDEPLIEMLGAQLLAAQTQHGGWAYFLHKLDAKDKDQAKERIKAIKADPPEPTKEPRKANKDLLRLVVRLRANGPPSPYPEDNSNTQFAMMALWVARRHGVPVDDALARVASRFRQCQQEQGTWGYGYDPKNPKRSDNKKMEGTPSFTCAGLLALALGQGVKKDAKVSELLKDPAAKKGLSALAKFVDGFADGKEKVLDVPNGYYFLWSLERMGVVYDVKKVGERDWYVWGAEALWERLERRGRWQGSEYRIADTCFAVLFLKRANVAEDLTKQLKLFNPIEK